MLEEESLLSLKEDIFGCGWKWREKSLGKALPHIALVETLSYMDEFYIPPSLDKTLKVAF